MEKLSLNYFFNYYPDKWKWPILWLLQDHPSAGFGSLIIQKQAADLPARALQLVFITIFLPFLLFSYSVVSVLGIKVELSIPSVILLRSRNGITPVSGNIPQEIFGDSFCMNSSCMISGYCFKASPLISISLASGKKSHFCHAFSHTPFRFLQSACFWLEKHTICKQFFPIRISQPHF